ncbi:Ig-like domain-containing protein [Marinobacter salexigens]|uniref:Ig-like domain-containing protein n=1 Tax=Marinobacter salexigens TaxID=1925763 RepID=A0ABS6A7I6_9GAMM|nr:Ig-like domain-containing protein [Marinobacter salexigens]MBU2874091.1 Ig-like domain-containing protein [Marinobacter salexigens]
MSGKFLARVLALSLALFLVACGGSDDSSTPLAGGDGSGNGGGTPDEVANVGSVQLLASPVQIGTSSGATSTLTALVKDPNGILLPGVPVQFSVNNNGTLRVDNPTTDESGTATAILSTSDDARNRTNTVSVSAGGKSDSVEITILGSSISIAGPSAVSLGDSVNYRITLSDGNGDGISNQSVTVTTNTSTVTSSNLTTNDGVVDIQLSAETSGEDVITVSAFSGESRVEATKTISISPESFVFASPAAATEINLNTPQTITLNWESDNVPVDGRTVRFSSTRGTLQPADGLVTLSNGQASVRISSNISGPTTLTATTLDSGLSTERTFEFVAVTANAIDVQATKTQLDLGETTEVLAVVRDQNNNLVKNQLVNFQIIADGSSGNLSSSTGLTDSLGRVSTTYTAGQSISARDGVVIRAAAADNSSVFGTLSMTVARRALRVVIGTGNSTQEPDEASYLKEFVAIVTDANGAPVEGAVVELSVLPVGYAKGFWEDNNLSKFWSRVITSELTPNVHTYCPNEDLNKNGILDAGEDLNQDGILTPTNPATTSVSSLITQSDGSGNFSIKYPQSVCGWVETQITATVRVGGTESVEQYDFALGCLADDLIIADGDPPGGQTSLYGTGSSCFDTE